MSEPKPFGRTVLISFILFFGLIIAVNSVFIYYALDSHPGIITENPYEKGLKFDETLNKAKNQPKIENSVNYENGVLAWILKDTDGSPIDKANVTVKMLRPVEDGHDKVFTLEHVGNGRYEAKLDLQYKGSWQAQLKAQWNNKEFQTQESLTIR